MKNLLMLFLCMLSMLGFSQNIGINVNGAAPHQSALLDIDGSAIIGTKRGFLGPRVTSLERDGIVSPAEGLEIYNLDLHCKEFFNGTSWSGCIYGNNCPYGMINLETFCVDSVPYTMVQWRLAVDTCYMKGSRLCTPSEIYLACEYGVPNMGAWEWTSDFVSDNTVKVMSPPPCWNNWSQDINTDHRFRCCKSR